MQNFAVVQIAHRQYLVEAGKSYTVDKFVAEAGTKSALQVLAVSDGDKLQVGKPLLDKAEVKIEIEDQGKGEKVTSRTFKAKSRYRKTKGHRKLVTTFKVLSIK